MSAWLVSKRHVDLLVSGAISYNIIKPSDATEFGRSLWLENERSLAALYGDPVGVSDDYAYEPYASEDPVALLKQIQCWDYQSCEHAGFRDSLPCEMMEELEQRILETSGVDAEKLGDNPAYAAAPWGVAA